MNVRPLGSLIRHLRRAVGPPGDGTPSDGQLLQRWVGQRDEAAFELLVWRHGPMVLAACRRLLRDPHAADDAFQATWLVLVRKAGSLRDREAVAAWLHRVACRVALRARAAASRRGCREQSGVDVPDPADTDEVPGGDLRAVLDEEIDRLPEHHRRAFVLCCLEGRTQAEAARHLGRPPGTVSSWLNRARGRLRARLARRGLAPAAGAAAGVLGQGAAPAGVPAALVSSTVRAATGLAAGEALAAGVVGARVVALTEGVLKAMFLSQLKLVAVTLLAAGAIGVGTVALTYPTPAAEPPGARADTRPDAGAGDPAPPAGRTLDREEARLRALKREEARLAEAQRATLQELRDRIRALEGQIRQARQAADSGTGGEARWGSWKGRATLRGHKSSVWCVAFSPDGKVVASGSGGTLGTPGELKLWDAATGRPLATLPASRSVRWAAFSSDGKLLATAEHDNTAKLRDARTGRVLRVLEGHDSGLDTATFSPDGKSLATSSWDKTAKLWDVATGRELKTLRGHEREVYAVAFSPDGRALVSGCADGTAKVWDAATGKERSTLRGHGGVVHAVAFSPDGKVVGTASWDRTVRLWDAATGKGLATLRGHTAQVLSLAFSPDGRTLASSSGRWGDYNYAPGPGEVILWDVATGKALAKLRGHTDRIFGVAFSPDGRLLATASWDGTVKVWEAARRKRAPDRGSPAPAPASGPKRGQPPDGDRRLDELEKKIDALRRAVQALRRDLRPRQPATPPATAPQAPPQPQAAPPPPPSVP